MNLQKARELAAQIYCEYEHQDKVLDSQLCESVARILVRETSAKGMYERALERIKANPELLSVLPTTFVVGKLKNPDERFSNIAEHILKVIFEIPDDDLKSKTP